MISPWVALEQAVDATVDAQFSEPVELHPWTGAGQQAVTAGQPDPSRPILLTEGIYCVPGSAATGEGGSMARGMSTRVLSADEWISISEDNLGDPVHWHAYDRVFLPERNPTMQWHSIQYVMPSATRRYNIYLIRIPNP